MKYVELNKKGDFERWNKGWLMELEALATADAPNPYAIFENEEVKLSVIGLESYERTPFQRIKNDFNLISLTGGLALSRSANGGIYLLNFKKGEELTYTLKGSEMIHDLQNISEELTVYVLIEFICPETMNDFAYDLLDNLLEHI